MVTASPATFVSILIPCRNEERHIAACLDSIRGTAYPADRFEILVLDGLSDDRTRAILGDIAARDARIRVIDNPARIAPTGLNIGIRQARGDIIVRMDAHAVYPLDYVPLLVRALEETGADNVGGVLITVPPENTATARAIAIVMSHPLGVGNSYFRIGTAGRRWVDTVPFGCFRRDVFARVGVFDEEMARNQDDEFNFRLLRHGGRILLEPSVRANYYTRRTLRQLGLMFFQYGYYKPLVARKVGRVMTVRQLVPAAFVFGVAGAAALAPWWPVAAWAGTAVAGAYAALVAAAAMLRARPNGWRCAAVLLVAFPVVHFSYGLGFLRGLLDHVLRPGGRRSADTPALSR
jgi:glycosyltransferase involved in cell wall biosynthesis